MAPNSLIVLCRHAQAEHNVHQEYSIPDAPLTALGKRQAQALAPRLGDLQNKVDVIVSSPLKRTLQTTKLGWGPAIARLGGLSKVVCLPQAQECNAHPCDTGSAVEILQADPEFAQFNFDLLTPDWTSKKGFWSQDRKDIANRAKWVRQWLRDRPEKTIVLVAHGDILRQITATETGPSEYGWKNAEARAYYFDEKFVDTEDCFLHQKENKAVVDGWGWTETSTDMELN